jgi:hypothetical protein
MVISQKVKLYTSFVLALGVVCVHFLAISNSWYWKWVLLDIPMHYFGGVLIAVLSWWFIECIRSEIVFFKSAVYVATSVLLVGLAWEVFEYATGLYGVSRDAYLKDTILDVIMDMLGAITIIGLIWHNYKIKSPVL